MKNSDEMKNKLTDLKAKAENLEKAEEIKNAIQDIKDLKAQIELAEMQEKEEELEIQNKIENGGAKPVENVQNKKHEYKDMFLKGIKDKFNTEEIKNAMKEGVNADGGYTVPQDIRTQINELREAKDALQNFVRVEQVNTLSGSRVYKTRATQTGFSKVDEAGNITEKATPQFKQIPYKVDKYAGFMKVTNELLKDSDQAIQSTLVNWIGNDSRVTRNKLILAELDKKAKTAITGIDDIKNIVNVTLDPAFRNTSMVITNQSGFNFLDKLKDGNGRYLLEDSVASPTGKMFLGMAVAVVSNKDLANDTATAGKTKAPIIIGDMMEYCTLFNREGLAINVSDVAGDAYLTDQTLFRAIERLQCVVVDDEAIIYGQVEV